MGEVKKGSGVYVTRTRAPLAPQTLSNSIGAFELLQARQLFESSIAEFTAIQASRNDIWALRDILRREKDTLASGEDDYREDEEFHHTIASITQNEALIRIQQE